MLRLCWRYLRPSRIEGPPLGPCWAKLGPSWAYLGPMLGLCWAYVGLCWLYVGPMLAYVRPCLRLMLAPCWPMLVPCWSIFGPMLRLCWRYVKPSLLKDLQDANFSFPDPSAEPKTRFCTFANKKLCSSKRTKRRKNRWFYDLTHTHKHTKHRKLQGLQSVGLVRGSAVGFQRIFGSAGSPNAPRASQSD